MSFTTYKSLNFSTVIVALFCSQLGLSAQAHEPVFSLGPETIFQGGTGIEIEYEYESGDKHKSSLINYEILYGLKKNLSLTLVIPQALDIKAEDGDSDSGLGDMQLRLKYQFYKRDFLGGQDKVAGIFGIKFPTGDDDSDVGPGTGTTDYLFGLAYGRESRSWYRFATLRYVIKGSDGSYDPGDELLYDAAFGYRPWKREYLEWDFVALLEMSGEYEYESEIESGLMRRMIMGKKKSGGNTIWLGPTGLLSYRNIMFKGGFQIPIVQDLKGNQDEDDFRAVLSMEYHF